LAGLENIFLIIQKIGVWRIKMPEIRIYPSNWLYNAGVG